MKWRPVSCRHNVSERCQVTTQVMLMPLEKSAQSESVWAWLSPSSERRGSTATLLALSHNSQILIMNVSTNPGMMIEWHQYGRHDYHSQELGHITHFLAKGCGSCRPREAYSDLFYGSTAPVGLGFLIVEISRTHSDTPQSVGLLWTSDRSVAETSTWQHTTLTRDKRSCPWRYSNPQSQQACGRRPTPSTAQPQRSALTDH